MRLATDPVFQESIRPPCARTAVVYGRPMAEREFDVVILGAGPAGEVAAGRIADGGLEVALVEPELVGGECSFWACMPSKALLRPAELLAEARRVPGLPIADGGLDSEAILARRDEVVHDWDDSGQLPWLEDRGIALFRGAGAIDGERRIPGLGSDDYDRCFRGVAGTVSLSNDPRLYPENDPRRYELYFEVFNAAVRQHLIGEYRTACPAARR